MNPVLLKCFFTWLREDSILVKQYLIGFQVRLCIILCADMKINPVSVPQLHKPPVTVFFIPWIIDTVFRILHIKPFTETINPAVIFLKGSCFLYNIYDIIILKHMPGHIRVHTGAFQVSRPYSFILRGCVDQQLHYFVFCSHECSPCPLAARWDSIIAVFLLIHVVHRFPILYVL